MTDKIVQMFRRLTLLCLLGVGAIATLTYADRLNPKAATITVAVLAVLLFIFDTLSEAPDDWPEPEGQFSRLMALKALADHTIDTKSGADTRSILAPLGVYGPPARAESSPAGSRQRLRQSALPA